MQNDPTRRRPNDQLLTLAIIAGITFTLALFSVWLLNTILVVRPLQAAMLKDKRNDGVLVSTHLQNFVNTGIIVFDLRGASSTKSRLDIMRVFLLFAQQEQNRQFTAVQLACKGDARYLVKGTYFQKLGRDYNTENPVYTIRTFPENVYTADGHVAYAPSDGGLLGLMQEVENFSNFMDKWCFRELAMDAVVK